MLFDYLVQSFTGGNVSLYITLSVPKLAGKHNVGLDVTFMGSYRYVSDQSRFNKPHCYCYYTVVFNGGRSSRLDTDIHLDMRLR